MSALTAPRGGLPRTVLRLHRPALLTWTVFVAALCGWLVLLTEVVADRARAAEARTCVTDVCGPVSLLDSFDLQLSWAGTLVCYGFLAVAAFTGGALIGRELESGTAELAWTQGVSPARWLTAKLALPALAVTAGGTALTLVFRRTWAADPDLVGEHWFDAYAFVARGPLVVAYGLCALAVGSLTALLLRRTLPSLAVATGTMWLLNAVLTYYRGQLWPTLHRTAPHSFDLPDGAWEVTGGRTAHGYFATYHPASHYWPLHLTETAIVAAVAALAVLLSFRLLKHRTESPV
ncbi:hypothetical protein ACIPX0_20075 [Streptomyces sp. NPDC090075]|uniref:hypothetical protein n=1 Tax=Streptomyces sp. NPDC090075 TaxID=3365937 RepID=UPI00381F6647